MPEAVPNEYQEFRKRKHEQWNTSEALVGEMVEKALGSPLASRERIVAGEINEVYSVVTASGQEAIVRIFHGEKGKFEKEHWALERCREAGVPVPEVFLVERIESEDGPLHFCIESKLAGVTMKEALAESESKVEADELLRQLGELLAKIHSVETGGFGVLDAHGDGKFHSVPELVAGDWNISFDEVLAALETRPADAALARKGYEILQTEAPRYSESSPRLAHNDLAPQHILVHEGKISGIIDFESAIGADPMMELARWEAKYGQTYPLEKILEGYGKDSLPRDFERSKAFWNIYRAFVSLRYCIRAGKQVGIENSLEIMKKSVAYFDNL
jgi:aminoglycoside phosphotransferase (APT) family kinase protein